MDENDITPARRNFLKAGAALGATAVAGLGPGMAAAARPQSALPLPEYERWDAIEIARRIRRGDVRPSEVLEAAIARAEAYSVVNAVTTPHFDLARELARALDAAGRAEREARPPFSGVPFALKDLAVALKGTVTTNGCAFFKDAVADHDSTLVQRYKAAGMNIFAKLATPEFGQTGTTESRLFGPTRNPWDLGRSSGGSSGGASAAVAAGVLPVAHASDGGGSIRIPASHCGLFGLKPSRGLIPMGPGALEGWMGLSAHNVISRSVRDTAWLMQLSQGAEPGTRAAPATADLVKALGRFPKGLKIGLFDTNLFGMGVHPECLEALHKAATLCAGLGHHVEPISLQQLPFLEMFGSMGVMTGTGMLYTVRAREKLVGRPAREAEFEPINWLTLQKAQKYTAEQLYAARSVFDQAGRIIDEVCGRYDLILSPTTAALPPKLGELSLDQPFDDFAKRAVLASPFTAMFNMSGHPAMSVPLHWSAEGMPIGVQFAAPYGGEARLIALAAQLEKAAPWADRRPPALA
ncbi:amidase [Aromatoleum evansii]|uniref:amidase n=1 Tax=Aromatoleum evansii TaxID=59406 RepID=UPI00145F23A9|nr:amidase [Aromatoleum evansii]NMG31565.1 amidase [Aromatoleum evansii]